VTRIGWLRLWVVIGFVAIVELVCRIGWIGRFTMIPPSEMATSLWRLLVSGKLTDDILFTLGNMAAAIFVSAGLGFILGLVIHALPRLRRQIDPLLAAYYAVPIFVFYPLFIVVFGLNRLPLIAIGAIFGTVGMIVNTIDGLDRVPRVLIKTARTLGMHPLKTALMIKLPAATPHLFTGIKLAVTYSVIGVVGGEFILAIAGLGRAIAFAYNDLDNATMYGLLLLLLTVVTIINVVLDGMEQRLYRRWGRV
jgi:NitT/TauT family transport system permease protein